jgi:hypothetical protein
MKTNFTVLAALALAVCLSAQDKPAPMSHEHRADKATAAAAPAAWNKIMSLSGDWEGIEAGDKSKTRITFHMSSGASAFIQTIDPGGMHEMLTVFTLDKGEVLGTHFCFGNQPRFRAVANQDPNTLVFELKDWTGSDAPGHMSKLVLTMVDADHHYEDWTYIINGKASTDRFDMRRVKN